MAKVRIFYDERGKLKEVYLKNIDLEDIEVYYEDDDEGEYARKRKACRLTNWEDFN